MNESDFRFEEVLTAHGGSRDKNDGSRKDKNKELQKERAYHGFSREVFYEYVREYSEYSTIAGMVYIFMENQNWFGKLYWTLTIIIMLSLSSYWIIIIYQSWCDQQVMTTITTTSEPISGIPYPTVFICSQGYNVDMFYAGIFKLMNEFLNQTSIPYKINQTYTVEITPIMAARLYRSFIQNGTSDNMTKAVMSNFNGNWNRFLNGYFPGLNKVNVPTIIEFGNILQTYSFGNIDLFIKTLSLTENNAKIKQNLVPYVLDTSVNPVALKQTTFRNVRNRLSAAIQAMDKSQSYENLVAALWYSKLPCFDLDGITFDSVGSGSLLRSCFWKGLEVKCSRIFNQIPTDLGMCCAFNMQNANQIYAESEYTYVISKLQERDSEIGFHNVSEQVYDSSDEPTTQSGVNMGLLVMLDSHTDLLEPFSVQSDFNSFFAIVKPSGEFPLSFYNGVPVKKGHRTTISLAATSIQADESIRSISPDGRKCYFNDEISVLKFNLNYTIANCFFECALSQAQTSVANLNGLSQPCTPWYMPFLDANHVVCDPWSAQELFLSFQKVDAVNLCAHCYPDCSTTLYDHSTTYEEIRECDENNLGSSYLCNLDLSVELPKPQIWASHVLEVIDTINSMMAGKDSTEKYRYDEIMNQSGSDFQQLIGSGREVTSGFNLRNQLIFTKIERDYEAYISDIGFLNVVFDEPTMMVYGTSRTQGWITFFSNVGGILGLCIGLSVITLVELIWFWVVLFWRENNKKNE